MISEVLRGRNGPSYINPFRGGPEVQPISQRSHVQVCGQTSGYVLNPTRALRLDPSYSRVRVG